MRLEEVEETLHVAVVHAGAHICFVTAARTRSMLAERVAAYVCEQAPVQLRSSDARRVAELAAVGEHEKAITHYFTTVGDKWDEERLVVTQVSPGRGADRGAGGITGMRACQSSRPATST